MGTMNVKDRTIELGEDGYLSNVEDWDEEVAAHLAAAEGIEMTDRHWEVVNFLRDYYKQYQIAPMIKIVNASMMYGCL